MDIYSYKKQYVSPLKSILLGGFWLILSLHLVYGYVRHFSVETNTKGGTYVEATTDNFSHLPYSSQNTDHNIIQNLLYKGCLSPVFSGVQIQYQNNLCNITTKNNKSFSVTIVPDQFRSDGEPITLEDIYFSYKTILKDNFWNIVKHESYKSITIDAYLDRLEISFPYASIDNKSFFVNHVLPVHRLANSSFSEYINTFSQEPIVSSCSRIVSDIKDNKSLLIDLTTCPEYPNKFYQIKQFTNQEAIESYLETKKRAIDSIISTVVPTTLSGYYKQEVLTQNFLLSFFNEQKSLISLESKQFILALFQQTTTLNPENFVADSYIFPIYNSITGITKSLINDQVEPKYLPTNLPDVMLFSGTYHQSYSIHEKISDSIKTTFVLPKSYDKLFLRHNNNEEIIVSTFNLQNNSAQFQFSEILRNITIGYNEYVLEWYIESVPQDRYPFSIFYGPRSGSVIAPAIEWQTWYITGVMQNSITSLPSNYIQPIHLLYYKTPDVDIFIQSLEKKLESLKLRNYFKLEWIVDQSLYEGKLQTKDYDIVIAELSLGLRKDISNIFLSDTPSLNPSLYINQSLSNEISRYFLYEWAEKQKSYDTIQNNYNQSIPLGFIAKIKQHFYTTEKLLNTIPTRVVNIGYRDALLRANNSTNSIKAIERKKAFSIEGFLEYSKKFLSF